MDFAGTTCLITGAASGIGLSVARHLAEHGAGRLVLVDRDAQALGRMALPCDLMRRVGDVADPNLWAEPLPTLDHAVVNAGIGSNGLIADLPFDEWRRVMSVNLDGAFLTLQAAMRALRDGGSAVIVASAAGLKAEKGIAAYAASKAAVIQLARVAAKEGAERRVRVNAIAPGGVETPIWESMEWFRTLVGRIGREAAYAELAKQATPLGRFGRPEEIAGQIAFLLSNEASGTMTGSVLTSDGGYTL